MICFPIITNELHVAVTQGFRLARDPTQALTLQ